jgi:hypothetical protein
MVSAAKCDKGGVGGVPLRWVSLDLRSRVEATKPSGVASRLLKGPGGSIPRPVIVTVIVVII